MNRKVFIDCGFYAGGSILSFKSTPEYSSDFIYYGFDPVLNLEVAKQKWDHVTLDNKAIWINDGEINFYISKRHGGRANSIYHNRRARKESIIAVKCFDFSAWLKNNFDSGDYLVVKMDIEGAEYKVVPKMIEDSTIDLIRVFYLEWHGTRTEDPKGLTKISILNELKTHKNLVVRQSIERYLRDLKRKEKIT